MNGSIEVPLPDGSTMRGHLALPALAGAAPAVLLVHEWFGLNAQIIETAGQLAQAGFPVLCADLYQGRVATDVDGARALIQTIEPAEALSTLAACAGFLRASPHGNGKVASMGFCLGGGWALNLAIAGAVDAAVVYYGQVEHTDAEVAAIRCPLLGHFGEQDQVFTPATVRVLENQLRVAGNADHQIHWYPAGHAFANPYRPLHQPESAALAWQRTVSFLHRLRAS